MNTNEIVQKLWNLCNILKDDGITYHQYVTELTQLLFLKMSEETSKSWKGKDKSPEERLPNGCRWKNLRGKEGATLAHDYRAMLVELGDAKDKLVAAIYANAHTNIREPKHLTQLVDDIDGIDWYGKSREDLPEGKLASLMLEPGDVLFTEGGDLDKLGRGWIWEGQIADCTYQNHIFRARLRDKRIQPKYVSWWANHRGLSYFLGSGKQTTNLASINKSQLSALPIQLPSPDEQAEIVAEVESLLAAIDQLETKVSSARGLADKITQNLMVKAFRGALVPQDPSDVSASRLLKQGNIKTEPATYATSGRTAIRAPRPRATIMITGSRPNVRGERHVLKRSAVSDSHLSTLLLKTGPVTPEILLRESQLDIDDFYDQLKDEHDRGLLREVRSGANNEESILEAVS